MWPCIELISVRGNDGLLAECYRMGLDPFSGAVVLFVGRCRQKLKLLFADDSGLWVGYKRFNAHTLQTKFRFLHDPSVQQISTAELQMFFEGSYYTIGRSIKNSTRQLGPLPADINSVNTES